MCMNSNSNSNSSTEQYEYVPILMPTNRNTDQYQPRSKIPVTRSRRNLQERDGKNGGSCRNTPEHGSSIPAGKFPDFLPVVSDQFPGRKHRKVIGMHGEKSGNFPAGILLSCSGDFRCIPAGPSRTL